MARRRPASASPPRGDPLSRDRTADMLKKLRALKLEAKMLKARIDTATMRPFDGKDRRRKPR
jgi:hypothetical protein